VGGGGERAVTLVVMIPGYCNGPPGDGLGARPVGLAFALVLVLGAPVRSVERYMGATAGLYRESLISRTAGMAVDGTQLAPPMPTTTHKLKELYLAVDGKATDRTGSWNTQYRVLRDSFGRLDTPGVWGWNSC
jgi:hypothetical protein